MAKVNNCAVLVVGISCLALVSCSSPYVGRSVKHNHPAVCSITSFPAECTYSTKDFQIDYTISENGAPGAYRISGTAKKTGGTTGSFTEYSQARFILLLVNDGKICQAVNIAGGRGSFSRPISFSSTFRADTSFQASLITYQMDARG